MKNASTRELYAYWNALREARPAPRRSEVDPIAMPSVLPDIVLLEMLDSGRVVVRLAGTRLCDLYGRELRGSSAAALWARDSRCEIDLVIRDVMAEAAVAVVAASGRRPGRPPLALELIFLPLADGEGRRRFVIGALSAAGAAPLRGIESIEVLEAETARLSWPSGLRAEPVFAEPAADDGDAGPSRRVGRFVVYDGGRDPTASASETWR